MTREFFAGVQSIVEPLLAELGFRLEECDDDVDGGRSGDCVVYFRSNDCKIQLYDSPQAGEINCMIAPLNASNTFGPYDRSGEWQYLIRFAIRQGVPLEDIMIDKLTVDFPTTDQLLKSVRDRIEKYFPVARRRSRDGWTRVVGVMTVGSRNFGRNPATEAATDRGLGLCDKRGHPAL
jgi:hypothetical protein